MSYEDQIRELSRIDFMIDAKTLFHERLASAPDRGAVLGDCLEEFRAALVAAEQDGELEPRDAEVLLVLGTESLTAEARLLGLA